MRSGFITRLFYSGIGHIVVFHRVCPPGGESRLTLNAGMEITPKQLEEIFQFFADRRYEFISLDQMAERLKGAKGQKKKFVVFTFDDGYKDNFTYAYPVFKNFDIPFTIYVTTNFPDGKAILWWYLLEDLIRERDELIINTGTGEEEFDCRTPAAKDETFYKIRSLVMSWSAAEYNQRVGKLFEPYGMDLYGKTSELALDWEQIERLSRDPLVTIGAHTVNHYALSKLSQAEAEYEILESKRKIESRTNREVSHFAYPFGGKDEAGRREFEMVKACGFKTAVTGRFANIFPQHGNYMECLPRLFIGPECSTQYFTQLVNGILPGISNKFKRIVTD